MVWVEKQIAEILNLWNSGMSSGEISKRLRNKGIMTTRNAVIGVIQRARCRGEEVRMGKKAGKNVKLPVRHYFGKPLKRKLTPTVERTPKAVQIRNIFNIEPAKLVKYAAWPRYEPLGACQYIHGEPYERNFCGAQCHGSYCEEHKAIVYQPRIK
jgi:hypothetical protein